MKGSVLLFSAVLLCAFTAKADTQPSLVHIAGDIQRIEGRLQALEARVDDLNAHSLKLEADYAQQEAKMASTISAIARMQRIPKEAVLVRPGGPLQAARTAIVLRSAIPALERDGAQLRTLWQDLRENRDQLAQQTREARAAKDALKDAHASLQAAMQGRGRQNIDNQEVEALAAKAADLRDLLTALQDREMDGIRFIPQGEVQMLPDDGGILPVSGVVASGFGGADKAQGVRIRALDGALVVAPLDGVVRYAGPFKGYGQIVIIAHKGGYHSLLAGLKQIDVDSEQNISKGEPVGLVHATKGGQNQGELYFELRLHGQAVNPKRKIPDL